MIRTLAKSIREYKKPSILAPVFVTGEVVMECIIPFIIANLVNEIKAGISMPMLLGYGGVLILMAGLSLAFGALAGKACSTASCGFAATCARTCSTRSRATPLRTSTSSPSPAWSHG